MTASTITFAVQLGSDGFAVARGVAERLKYHYLDWEVTSRAAADAGVSTEMVAQSEQSRGTLQRIVQSLMASSSLISEDVTLLSGPSAAAMSTAIGQLNSGGYRYFVEDVVRELAERGEAVIVGHAGQVILQGDDQVLKVLICGSARRRAERLAAEGKQSFDAAMNAVQKSDKERKAFFKKAYGVDLLDAHLYDLTINTDRLSLEEIIESVLSHADSIAVPTSAYAREHAAVPAGAVASKATTAVDGAGAAIVPATKQRDALIRAVQGLEALMDTNTGDAAVWAASVATSLNALKRVFERHVRESEAADGSLGEVVKVKPNLARRVNQVKVDHARIQNQIADFVVELNSQIKTAEVNVEALKEHIVRLQVSLRLHEARGSDLLHEAYMRDYGGEAH